MYHLAPVEAYAQVPWFLDLTFEVLTAPSGSTEKISLVVFETPCRDNDSRKKNSLGRCYRNIVSIIHHSSMSIRSERTRSSRTAKASQHIFFAFFFPKTGAVWHRGPSS